MIRIITVALLLSCGILQAQLPWPSVNWNNADNLTAIMDTDGINDLSGLHWNPVTNRLYCVQGDGRLRVLEMNATAMGFTQIASKVLADGPEGITQANFSANEFYTIDENNYEIRKFTHNSTYGNLTEARHWDLLAAPSPMDDTGNTGPEGIVFVPDAALSAAGFVSQQTGNLYTSLKGMGGLMFVAHQDEGYIWVFDVNPNVNNDFAYVGKYKTNREESTDLAFDRTTGMLYILHNIESNYLEVTDLSSAMVGSDRKLTTQNEYYLGNPTDGNINIEGFAITPKCPAGSASVWLARDVENNEDDAVLQDALRWFAPFTADGNCAPLSVDDIDDEIGVMVFPNPGNHEMTVSFSGRSETGVTVLNCLGQTVAEKMNTVESVVFDTSLWATGVYLVQIKQGHASSVKKWIKE